jgi:hypothetical protein
MFNITDNISISAGLENGSPTYPISPIDNDSDQVWDKYFKDLEQYHYQLMLNNYKKEPPTIMATLNIKFKGIG